MTCRFVQNAECRHEPKNMKTCDRCLAGMQIEALGRLNISIELLISESMECSIDRLEDEIS
jgi:hypothetical protein